MRKLLNVYGTLITKCPKCFWHDYYNICPICDHLIPEKMNCTKEGFLRCNSCGAITHKTRKRWKPISIPLLKRRTKERINFSFLSNGCAFYSFCYSVFNKVLVNGISCLFFFLAFTRVSKAVCKRTQHLLHFIK